jgi:hypothetical protein
METSMPPFVSLSNQRGGPLPIRDRGEPLWTYHRWRNQFGGLKPTTRSG